MALGVVVVLVLLVPVAARALPVLEGRCTAFVAVVARASLAGTPDRVTDLGPPLASSVAVYSCTLPASLALAVARPLAAEEADAPA